MARIKIESAAWTHEDLREEIDQWVSSEDERNITFIKSICQAVQAMVVEYYKDGATPENRSQRLEEIRQTLSEIGFEDGGRNFTIVPDVPKVPDSRSELVADIRVCPDGRQSIGGICP